VDTVGFGVQFTVLKGLETRTIDCLGDSLEDGRSGSLADMADALYLSVEGGFEEF
jgi:hypothetical protein